MIAIVNYGVGNLFSLESSFNAIGQSVKVTSSPEDLKDAERIILPGVGAFGDAAEKLFSSGLAEPLINEAKRGKPILGICLGMQLLFTKSYEFGEHDGLNLIPGEIRAISEVVPKNLKIPQMGWNALDFVNPSAIYTHTNSNISDPPVSLRETSPLSRGDENLASPEKGRCLPKADGGVLLSGTYVYFVHSYSAFCDEKYITATTDYGAPLTASVQNGNVFGVQYHPEKSGNVGLNILREFCEVKS